MIKEVGEMKDSVNMAHNMITDEIKERKEGEKKLSTQLEDRHKEICNNTKVLKEHGVRVKNLGETVESLSSKVDVATDSQKNLTKTVNAMKSRMDSRYGTDEYPTERTVVAQKVWYREDEDITKVAETIIHKALQLPSIKIVRALRKSGWKSKSGTGLIKIELESSEDVETVLKNKASLNKAPSKELREVYLRQSKKEETLVMEKNVDLILNDMGIRGDYIRLRSGYLKHKEVNRNWSDRGRGSGYRGSRGGRG